VSVPAPGITPAGPYSPSAPASLRRLTAVQYRNAVRDLLGPVTPPTALEPDVPEAGFTSVTVAKVSVSARGVEQYEAAAYDVAHQVFASNDRRLALVGCTPTASKADACARKMLDRLGRRAWRRPLDATEIDLYAALAATVGTSFGDAWVGLEYAVAALLQSPFFLYRSELGEPAPAAPDRLRYTPFEMASRLAFTLAQSVPDDALLDAAAQGKLNTADDVRAQARRLLAAPAGRDAVRTFFGEHFQLDRLDQLVKDAQVYPRMKASLATSMRGEIEMGLAADVFDGGGDVRRMFDGRSTFVNAELARFYGVTAPASNGFMPIDLPVAGPRAGLFGWAGMMAMLARATATSPTLRGKFVRERLMCQPIPDPPANVDATLPAPTGPLRTMRERLEQHRANPTCAGCHGIIDPIGLGLEKFDGIGAYRDTDAGQPIDARGDINGKPFDGALALATLLRNDDATAACLVRQAYRFAAGNLETTGDEGLIAALGGAFRGAGYRMTDLLVELTASDGFRFAARSQP
jgi:hypothetical protein